MGYVLVLSGHGLDSTAASQPKKPPFLPDAGGGKKGGAGLGSACAAGERDGRPAPSDAAAIDHAFDLAEKCGRRAVVMLLGKGSDATQHVANGYEDVETDSVLAARHIAAHDAR